MMDPYFDLKYLESCGKKPITNHRIRFHVFKDGAGSGTVELWGFILGLHNKCGTLGHWKWHTERIRRGM